MKACYALSLAGMLNRDGGGRGRAAAGGQTLRKPPTPAVEPRLSARVCECISQALDAVPHAWHEHVELELTAEESSSSDSDSSSDSSSDKHKKKKPELAHAHKSLLTPHKIISKK